MSQPSHLHLHAKNMRCYNSIRREICRYLYIFHKILLLFNFFRAKILPPLVFSLKNLSPLHFSLKILCVFTLFTENFIHLYIFPRKYFAPLLFFFSLKKFNPYTVFTNNFWLLYFFHGTVLTTFILKKFYPLFFTENSLHLYFSLKIFDPFTFSLFHVSPL